MNLSEIAESMRRLSNERREAQRWLEDQDEKATDKEMVYRQAKGTEWTASDAATVAERQVLVDAATAELKRDADLADRLSRAAREKVRGVVQEMSLFQTYMALERSVTDLHRFDESEPQESA